MRRSEDLRKHCAATLTALVAWAALSQSASASEPGALLLDGRYRLQHFELEGAFELDRRGETPRLTGSLRVEAAADDLRPDDPSDEMLDREQPWDLLRRMEGDLRVELGALRVGAIKVKGTEVRLLLDDSKVVVDAEGNLQGGPASLHLVADARKEPPSVVLNLDLEEARVADIVEEGKATGMFEAHSRLAGTGRSLREVLAHATGTVRVGVGQGMIEAAPLGPLGRDLFQIFAAQIDQEKERTINCAAVHTELDKGVGPIGVVLDAGTSTLGGSGVLDLPGWRADLVLRPRSKKPTVGAFKTPIRISGQLGALRARLDAAALARDTGQVLVLGVLSPWLIAVPLVDMGTGEGNPCEEALLGATNQEVEQHKDLLMRGIESTRNAGGWIRDRMSEPGVEK